MNSMSIFELELKAQSEELRSSRQLLEETFNLYARLYDRAAAACLSFDSKGCVRELNMTAANLFKVNRDWMIGKPLAQWIDKDSRATFYSHLRNLSVGVQRKSSQLRLALKDGTQLPIVLVSVGQNSPDQTCSHQSSIIDLRDLA